MKDAFGGGSNKGGGEFNLPSIPNKLIAILVVLVVLIAGFSRSVQVIDSRERGIVKHLGKLAEKTLEPGVHIEIPFISVIQKIDVTTRKIAMENIKIYTKDQQSAVIDIVANYNISPDRVGDLYKKLGALNRGLLEDTILLPIIKSTAINELGRWTAEQVITNKEVIAMRVFDALQKSQDGLGGIIKFTNLEIVSIKLDEAYEAATRAKVIAEQQAKTAENKTKQIQEEAKQKIIQAQAEAESMRIRSEALSRNKALIEYEAVQKWDGKLPQYNMGNSVPFVNLNTAK